MSRVNGWPNKPRPKSTATDCARIVAAERKINSLNSRNAYLRVESSAKGHRIGKLKDKIENQRKRIVQLEGATNHATGTPLTRATLEISALGRRIERLVNLLLEKDRTIGSLKREIEELQLKAAVHSFTKIKAVAFAGGFSLGLRFSGVIEKSSGVLFEMDGTLFDLDGEESDA